MKKRYKAESLPHMRNRCEKYRKITLVGSATGGRNEADDEREEEGNGDRGREISECQE